MATPPTVSPDPTTQQGYAAQFLISAAVVSAIRELWGATSPLSSEQALQAFGAGAQAVVGQWSQAAQVTASDHYRAARINADVTGRLRLPPIAPKPEAKIAKELAWIEKTRIEREAEALIAEFEAQILKEAAEAFEKIVADEARQYTVEAVVGDENAIGFRRVARPDACAWCIALATRRSKREGLASAFMSSGGRTKSLRGRPLPGSNGEEHWGVYKSRALAGQTPPGTEQLNRFHFNCHCTVQPVFSTDFTPPSWLVEMADLYDDSDDFNDFRRRLNARRGVAPRTIPTLPIARPQSDVPDVLAALNAAMSAAR